MQVALTNARRRRIGLVIVGFLLVGVMLIRMPAQASTAATRADLEKVADQSNVEITTIGRKSGQPHTKPVWFVYDQGHFYIQSGKEGKSDWYLNLKKNPQLSLKIGDLAFSGKAAFIDDPKETERIHGLFSAKYFRARFSGLVGSQVGHGKVVEVELGK